MKIAIVTGSRDWPSPGDINHELTQFQPDLIVHGACPDGADEFASEYAQAFEVSQRKFHADWRLNGKAAGPMRNDKMAIYGKDMIDKGHEVKCFAFRLNESRGTTDCVKRMRMRGVPVVVRDMVSGSNE